MLYLAKTLAGLEEVLAHELAALGAQDITPLKRAVQFSGDQKLLYRANYELRTAIRIIQPIATFRARNEMELYRQVYDINWPSILQLQDTFAIDAATNSEIFRHSKYASLKMKDAIADRFRNQTGRRPDVDPQNPVKRLNLHIYQEQCTVSLDSSGDSLHKRGYRAEALEAPINEVLAAGIILLTGWQADRHFIDPMCGSGTLLLEAAMIARQVPPQMKRRTFGFMRWADFDAGLWMQVKREAKARIKPFEHQLWGSDNDLRAIALTRSNAAEAGLEQYLSLQAAEFEQIHPPAPPGIVVMNPPYDERLQVDDVTQLYKSIGDKLKSSFSGYEAWIISANADAVKHIGLKASKKYTLFNGPLECKLLRFDMYEGSKKISVETEES
ncbi:MAG: class I SAM-dependent RNA methyltransferase [Saprospiraceae bacterium]|nr:class I SAM-dependent RNA methyltransferase [Saprospiraceae bacterium]